MCDPISISLAAGLATTAIGTGLKAKADQDAGNAALATAASNRALAEQAAQGTVDRGDFQANQELAKGAQVVGAQRAGYAASGVDVGSGSPLSVMAGTAAISAADAQMIRNNAAREAWGIRTTGSNMMQAARYQKQAADFSTASTIIGGASSLATQGATAYKQWGSGGAAPTSDFSKTDPGPL